MTDTESHLDARLAPEPLAAAFTRVRALSEALAEPLEPEDQCIQSMPDVSPTKWHLAHTTWFFETFVLAAPDYPPYRAGWDFLFNSYYQTVGTMHARPKRGLLSRPTVDEILAYRREVDARVRAALPALSAERRALLELGLHHEQQHQELLLTDIKHVLAQNPLAPAYRSAPPPGPGEAADPGALRWVEDPGGLIELGRVFSGPGKPADGSFGFDNEGPRHKRWLEPFALAHRPTTCGEYLAFMDDGGYARPELWLAEGWDVILREGWQAPMYWRRPADAAREPWRLFTLDGLVALDLHAPVCHLSYYEADAYARWAGARLPTEAEWEQVAAALAPAGNLLPTEADAVLARASLHPRPADPKAGDSSGLAQMFGDVWEWTASGYQPYPGYQTPPGPVGEYNGKFMCNQLVLRGGSCATPRDHIRAAYRNFFHAPARWQFSGLRLARSLALALALLGAPGLALAAESFAIPPGQEEAIRKVLSDAITAAEDEGQLPLPLAARLDIQIDRDHFYVALHAEDEARSATLPHLVVYHPEAETPAGARLLATGLTLRCGAAEAERPCSEEEAEPWKALAGQIERRRATVADRIWQRRGAEPEAEPAPAPASAPAPEPEPEAAPAPAPAPAPKSGRCSIVAREDAPALPWLLGLLGLLGLRRPRR